MTPAALSIVERANEWIATHDFGHPPAEGIIRELLAALSAANVELADYVRTVQNLRARLSEEPTWQKRAVALHGYRVVTNSMVQARMQEEIDGLRAALLSDGPLEGQGKAVDAATGERSSTGGMG